MEKSIYPKWWPMGWGTNLELWADKEKLEEQKPRAIAQLISDLLRTGRGTALKKLEYAGVVYNDELGKQFTTQCDKIDGDRTQWCIICCSGHDSRQFIKLDCDHTFHTPCLREWVNCLRSCPNCKKPIVF